MPEELPNIYVSYCKLVSRRNSRSHRFVLSLAGSVACLFGHVLMMLFAAPGCAGTITAMYVFGDSLSDTGNVLHETKGKFLVTPRPDVPWYDAGRFTNGKTTTPVPDVKATTYGGVWHERLADKLKIKPASNSLGAGNQRNRAYGGATTAMGTFSTLKLPNMGEQVKQFLDDKKREAIKGTELFALWGGSNDVRDTAMKVDKIDKIKEAATTALANTKQMIADLAKNGAKRFLWPNLPPLDQTSEAKGKKYSKTQLDGLKQAAELFRDQQKQTVAMLSKENPGLTIDILDVYGEFLKILEKPADYGLTNVTDNIIEATDFSGLTFDAKKNSKFEKVKLEADKFLFWDQVHPTARAHELIAMKAVSFFVPEPEAWVLVLSFAVVTTSQRRLKWQTGQRSRKASPSLVVTHTDRLNARYKRELSNTYVLPSVEPISNRNCCEKRVAAGGSNCTQRPRSRVPLICA